MNLPRLLPLVLALAALLVAPVSRAAPATPAAPAEPAPAPKLYVTIATFEPIRFQDYRLARKQRGDLVLPTLRQTAASCAKLAGLPNEIVVLDEDAPPPPNAAVLRLTWTDGSSTVTADLTEQGKNHYLGVASRYSMFDFPEHKRLTRALTAAALPDDRNDVSVATEAELNLYFSLKLVANFRARAAAKP